MKKLFPLALAFLITMAPPNGQAEPANHESVKQLMQITGAGQVGIQVMQQMTSQFSQLFPEVPASLWATFLAEVKPSDLVDLIIPIYQQHLNEQEVQDIIAFYQTPAGKKLVQSLPMITQESMVVGQQWGQNVATTVLKQYEESLKNADGLKQYQESLKKSQPTSQ